MKLSASVLLALYLVAPSGWADIFKCKDDRGNDKYQNFPCPIDSIGSKATAAPPREQVGKAASQPAAPPASPSVHKQPQPGMKMKDVRAAWGEPKTSEVIKGVEIWYYDGPSGTTRSVRFDRTGTILAIAEKTEGPDHGDDDSDEAPSTR